MTVNKADKKAITQYPVIGIAVWEALFIGENLRSRIIAYGACQAGGMLLGSSPLIDPEGDLDDPLPIS